MKHLSYVITALCLSLAASPCLGEQSKKGKNEARMKNEPKSFNGLACGDTPYKKFSPDEYMGRAISMGCAKVYEKKGIAYIFNDSGQLQRITLTCKPTDMQGLIKKHGKPSVDKKAGGETYESRALQWSGTNTSLVFMTSTMTIVPSNPPMETCSMSYYCNNVTDQTDEGCNYKQISEQETNIDSLPGRLGIVFGTRTPLDTEQEPANKAFVDGIVDKILAMGLPRPAEVKGLEPGKQIYTLYLVYDQKDYPQVKKALFASIGDITPDARSLNFQGKKIDINVFLTSISNQYVLSVSRKFEPKE
jgi:hypothetical protein